MIYLLTAVPGSGKTLFAIDYFIKSGKFEGRPIYSNINGLDYPEKGILESPDDWRDTPPGSLVIYDEAQALFPATGKAGRPSDPRLIDLETHRHKGYDLVFITQNASQLHHQIRRLVGKHFHLFRAAKLQSAAVYEHDSLIDTSKLSRYSSRIWKFPKDIYEKYTSTVEDTHSGVSFPRRIIILAIFIIALVLFVGFNGYRAFLGFNAVSQVEEINEKHQNPQNSQNPVNTSSFIPSPSSSPESVPPKSWDSHPDYVPIPSVPPPLSAARSAPPPITGCISSSNKCMCFSSSGDQLLLPVDVCLAAIKQPIPVKVRSDQRTQDSSIPSSSLPFSYPSSSLPPSESFNPSDSQALKYGQPYAPPVQALGFDAPAQVAQGDGLRR